jgi:hypothetical protein|tara:strand:- start:1506 stop:1955 length:450 start_codon:yes stop_codon:yes gene_type:complete
MASKVSKATMSVVYHEEITLNSTKYGSRTSFEVGDINEISQRIVSIPTSVVTLLNLSSSVGPGQYVTSNMKYVRLTNLDTENWVRLTFVSASANQYDVRLDANRSYVFTNASISGSNAAATFDSFVDFTALKAIAETDAVDVEVFIAST